MFIFNQTITDALNDGYEVAFRANKDAGPGVLEVALRRDEFKYKHFIDTVLLNDCDDFLEKHIEQVIRYGMYEFGLYHIENLKGEKKYEDGSNGRVPGKSRIQS